MVGPIEPGSGGGINHAGAALRPVGAAEGEDVDTGPMITGASEGVGVEVGIEGGSCVFRAQKCWERREKVRAGWCLRYHGAFLSFAASKSQVWLGINLQRR